MQALIQSILFGMARLRKENVTKCPASDDLEFVPVDFAINTAKQDESIPVRQQNPRASPRKKNQRSYRVIEDSSDVESDAQVEVRLVPKTTPKKAQLGRQRVLKSLGASPFSLTLQKPLLQPLDLRRARPDKVTGAPTRLAELSAAKEEPPVASIISDDSEDEVDVEESIWCGSNHDSEESEEELPSVRKLIVPGQFQDTIPNPSNVPLSATKPQVGKLMQPSQFDSDIASRLPGKILRTVNTVDALSRPGSSSDKENTDAVLRFSPPRLHSPSKIDLLARPVTPPQSPSKSRLQSPSKTKQRIPTPPLRQSLDAFWNADAVNDWNEQYSPKKLLKSSRKLKFHQDESSQSPSSSPRKPQSPSKRTKAELNAKKSFSAEKHRLASDFLAELDQRITGGQIATLSAPSGGVRILWSKTLNSTAGRANWRKETTKSRQLDGTTTTTQKHFASIELAEKVIDDEHRLLNVLSHEFCHLANFMISGIKDQPHGKQFKVWGRKCTEVFRERGVEVTTKHSYQIEYKFVWQCENEMCGAEFKRHSKSIDPGRKVCGSCKGRLVQVKPVPRGASATTGYAAFVKENFAGVKKGMVGMSQKEVMEAVGRKYRAEKEAKGLKVPKTDDALEMLTSAVEVITLDDD